MIRAMNTKLEWNGTQVQNLTYNHNRYINVYWNGELVIYPEPITPGDYIYYSLSPVDGYEINTEKENTVLDKGTPGTYPGVMYSGRFLDLTGGSLEIPTNSGGSITYFDFSSKEFIQIDTTTTSYIFQDVVIGPIIMLWDRVFPQSDLDIFNADPVEVIKWGTGKGDSLSIQPNPEDKVYPITEYQGDIIREIHQQETITIQGTYSRILESEYGLQNMRLLHNQGTAFKVIENNIISIAPRELIDTSVGIDSVHDFSMMLSFSLPLGDYGENQYLAYANSPTGDNVYIMYPTGNALNELVVGLGRQVFNLTVDPALINHAMIVVWNAINQEVQFSYDGYNLSPALPFIFQGYTNPMVIGARDINGSEGFDGNIGEGVLYSGLLSNTEWLDFWNRVKDVTLTNPVDEIECDELYACEEYFVCDLNP